MGNQSKKVATTVIGVLTALVIVFSQSFNIPPAESKKGDVTCKKEASQKPDQEHNQEAYHVMPSCSMPSSAHIELDHESSFIFEISYECENGISTFYNAPRIFSSFLKTLFGVIISPNAP